MAFTVPSREALHTEGISDYSSSQPDKSVSKGSTPWLLMRVVSGLAWSIVAKLLFFDKNRLPDTAEDAYLRRWGGLYAFPSQGPAGAARALALRVTGTVAAAVTDNAQFTHADGTIYKNDSVGAVIGGGGFVDISVSAISKGAATNKIAGEILTFTSPPLNVNATATLVLDLRDGRDDEDIEAYRARFLAHIGDPPTGGAIHDYQERALEVAGNATAYVWKDRRGQGTIDVAVLGVGHGADRIIVDTTPTQEHLDDTSWRPGNVKDVLVLDVIEQEEDVKLVIEIDETKYRWDFTDDGTGYTITDHDQGASTIEVTGAPAVIVAGIRIQVLGEEALVTNRTGDVLTLAFPPDIDGNAVTWFTFADPDGENVRASGDLVVPVRNAILKLFDRLGPARDVRYAKTFWEADLQVDSIVTAARNVPGCTKATVEEPSDDVEATDPLNGSTQIPLITPGVVQVVQS